MRVSRLYVPTVLQSGQELELSEDSAHYLRTVLRLKQNADLVVFNGNGGEFFAKVLEVHRKRVVLALNEWQDNTVESELQVSFGLAISRGDRMDYAVQKAVELGVKNITPLFSQRCVVQLKEDKQIQRLQHWQKIAQHAAEQSHRTIVPELKKIDTLNHWIEQQQGLKVFLDPYADTVLNALQPVDNTVTLLSGPEGGFSDNERQLAVAAGFTPVKLGKRVLRAETAALAALAAVQTLWGDFC